MTHDTRPQDHDSLFAFWHTLAGSIREDDSNEPRETHTHTHLFSSGKKKGGALPYTDGSTLVSSLVHINNGCGDTERMECNETERGPGVRSQESGRRRRKLHVLVHLVYLCTSTLDSTAVHGATMIKPVCVPVAWRHEPGSEDKCLAQNRTKTRPGGDVGGKNQCVWYGYLRCASPKVPTLNLLLQVC